MDSIQDTGDLRMDNTSGGAYGDQEKGGGQGTKRVRAARQPQQQQGWRTNDGNVNKIGGQGRGQGWQGQW